MTLNLQLIAVKLRHMMGSWLNFIMQVINSGGSPQKNLGVKTYEISDNFVPLQTLIANISGMRQHIQNRKTTRLRAIPPAFDENNEVNFGPLPTENSM